MQPTPYEDVNRVLAELLVRIQQVLAAKLVGLYLYGSLRTGDFDPNISDIDLLAATASDVNDAEEAGLQAMHREFARDNPVWDNRVEVAYLSTAALHTFRSRRSPLTIISPGEPLHRIDAGTDWLMNWYVVREKGLALLGPAPQTLIAPIAHEEFIHSLREHAAGWREWVAHKQERNAQGYAILTMCRALCTFRTGGLPSKQQAALWTMEQMPEWSSLIANALAWRAAWRNAAPDSADTYPETVRFVEFMSRQITG